MGNLREEVLETLAGPDMIQKGDFGELLALKLYPETPLSVAYQEIFLAYDVAYREVSAEESQDPLCSHDPQAFGPKEGDTMEEAVK